MIFNVKMSYFVLALSEKIEGVKLLSNVKDIMFSCGFIHRFTTFFGLYNSVFLRSATFIMNNINNCIKLCRWNDLFIS